MIKSKSLYSDAQNYSKTTISLIHYYLYFYTNLLQAPNSLVLNNNIVLTQNNNKDSAVITTTGHIMFYNAEDEYGYEIASGGGRVHDEFLYQLFPLIVRKGDLVMDIGANYGYFSMQMAEIIGNEGAVIAIELNSQCANRMKKSFEVNYFNNIKSLNIGISHGTYKSFMCNDPHYDIHHSLGTAECVSSDAKDSILANNIVMSSIEAIVGNECNKQLSFIRIDVEGNECRGILGASYTIENSSDLVVSFEWQNYLVPRYSSTEEQKKCLNLLYDNKYLIVKTDEYIKIHGEEFSKIENYGVEYEDIVTSNMQDYVALTESAYNNRLNKEYNSNITSDCLNRVSHTINEEYLFDNYASREDSYKEYSDEL